MDNHEELHSTLDRLSAAAAALEQLAHRLTERSAQEEDATVSRIVAMVDQRRDCDLEQKLAAAEQKIAELEARASGESPAQPDSGARKTVSSAMTNLLGKHGLALESLEAGTLDAALAGLSLEQRIAVKAQLLRAGLLSRPE